MRQRQGLAEQKLLDRKIIIVRDSACSMEYGLETLLLIRMVDYGN